MKNLLKRILITGFEPFGNQETNASWEIAQRLPDVIGENQIYKMQIPVVFGLACQQAIRTADEVQPDVILCLGQAAGRSAITPEMVAINLRHNELPDNQGKICCDEPILREGPAAYFSTLPVREMAKAMSGAGAKADVSYSAGTYVCNDLLYGLLHHYQGSGTRVGFIHVPLLREQARDGQPYVELEQAVKAITAAISLL